MIKPDNIEQFIWEGLNDAGKFYLLTFHQGARLVT